MRKYQSKIMAISAIGGLLLSFVAVAEVAKGQAPGYDERAKSATSDQLQTFKDALKKSRSQGTGKAVSDEEALDSYVSGFAMYLWKEPKAQLSAAALVVGEGVLASMLWKRMELNRATWQSQVGTVKGVAKTMAPATAEYAAAERDMMKSLVALEAADRAEVLSNMESMNGRARELVEKAIKPGTTPTEGGVEGALSLEEATQNLVKKYSAWQNKAASEVRVLNAARRAPIPAPQAIEELMLSADQGARQVTKSLANLNYTSGQFFEFKNAGMKQLAESAGHGLGRGLSWKAKLWRKARTGLLLAAIPVFVVGIEYYFDSEAKRNRRIQDLNIASTKDRDKWLGSMLPQFGRPLLFQVVRAWKQVQAKENSRLKQVSCPFELRPAGVVNPDVITVQSMALAILTAMENEHQDVLVMNEERTVVTGREFYRRLFQDIIKTQKTVLSDLSESVTHDLVEDLADEAYHGFDRVDYGHDDADTGAESAVPSLSLGK